MLNLSQIRTSLKKFWNHGNFAIIFLYTRISQCGNLLLAVAFRLRRTIDATHAGSFGLSTVWQTLLDTLFISAIVFTVLGVLLLWVVYLGIKVLLVKPALALYTHVRFWK